MACLGCAKARPEFRCGRCRVARFCGEACQRRAAQEHRPYCAPPDDASAAGEAHWLLSLGLRQDGKVVGQRQLSEQELWDYITASKRGLARLLFGRNGFEVSLRPLLRAMTAQGRWPLVMSSRPQGHVTELPSWELCALLSGRLLRWAQLLRAEGQQKLIFLGIGSGDALVEAAVALHLGAALGKAVDLEESPLRVAFAEDFEICVIATDSEKDEDLSQNRVAEAPRELDVQRLGRREAVRRYAKEAPLYVFSCWMPMHAVWCSDVVEDAGTQLAEMCFLSAPPELIQVPRQEVHRAATAQMLATQEVFPKTLSRWDFLASGFALGEEGLFHSQLYITARRGGPPCDPPAPLLHTLGCYRERMLSDSDLTAVNVCRGVGLFHVHSRQDLAAAVPGTTLLSLRQALCEPGVQERFAECLKYLQGTAYKQVARLFARAPG
ncbi:unnamed protein product [Effrenium voratum]|nr:unnamed protein product [Effrenium voratum]